MSAGDVRRVSTRLLDLAGWIVVAVVGALTLTQAFGWAGTRIVAIAQSLTPYLGLLVVPVVIVAFWRYQLVLATVAAAIGLGILVLAAPLAFPDDGADPIVGAVGLRVAAVNLLYSNERIDEVAGMLDRLAADVIVFSEYTAEHRDDLLATPLVERYAYLTERPGPFGEGVAVWSRRPVDVAGDPDTFDASIDLTVDGPDGKVRIVAVHLPTPVGDFDAWRDDLAIAEEIGRTATGPTLLIGDLNASYWHPDYRRLLDAGFIDAHTAAGSGFSTSWPTGRWFPPFVRLDHALTTAGLVSTAIDDFEVPDSDHRGLIVTVAPARRAAP